MTKRLELSIISIIVAVAELNAAILVTVATHGFTDFVFARGQAKFGFIEYKYNI
jgi:hypothetical protein